MNGLKKNTSLNELSLYSTLSYFMILKYKLYLFLGNKIQNIDSIGSMLEINQTLTKLDLSCNTSLNYLIFREFN